MMKILTLDFETLWDTNYTLRKMPTSLYVQDERFETVSLAFKTTDMEEPVFVGGPAKIKKFFKLLAPQAHTFALCCHNAQFDGYIASHYFGFVPRFYIDTLSMARALYSQYGPLDLGHLTETLGLASVKGEMPASFKGKRWADLTGEERQELATYNKDDVLATEALAAHLLPQISKSELKIIDMTVRMVTQPRLRINVQEAKQIIQDEKKLKKSLADQVGIPQEVLRSDSQFAAALEERGYEVPMKWSEKKQAMSPAFAQADLPFQKMRDSDDPELRRIIAARTANKSSINETRARGMLARSKYPVPIFLNMYGGHTTRWSGADKFNPQNLPREGRLRKCLEAPDGHVLVIVDASQIEARDNATFNEQWDLVKLFASGADPYAIFASDLYGFEVNKKEYPDERFVGKVSILGLGYQMGAAKFQLTLEAGMMGPPLKISFEQAQRAVNVYRSRFDRIKQGWYELQARIPYLMDTCNRPEEFRGLVIHPGGRVDFPAGVSMFYPNVGYTIGSYDRAEFYYKPYDNKYKTIVTKKLYGGSWLENIIQCRARCMTAGHSLQLSKHYPVVLTAHDEIIMCVPIKKADRCFRDALEIMSIPPRWNEKCPLAAEGEISKHYTKPE